MHVQHAAGGGEELGGNLAPSGAPPAQPSPLRCAIPSRVRAEIRARSNSAAAIMTCVENHPLASVVSMAVAVNVSAQPLRSARCIIAGAGQDVTYPCSSPDLCGGSRRH